MGFEDLFGFGKKKSPESDKGEIVDELGINDKVGSVGDMNHDEIVDNLNPGVELPKDTLGLDTMVGAVDNIDPSKIEEKMKPEVEL